MALVQPQSIEKVSFPVSHDAVLHFNASSGELAAEHLLGITRIIAEKSDAQQGFGATGCSSDLATRGKGGLVHMWYIELLKPL